MAAQSCKEKGDGDGMPKMVVQLSVQGVRDVHIVLLDAYCEAISRTAQINSPKPAAKTDGSIADADG